MVIGLVTVAQERLKNRLVVINESQQTVAEIVIQPSDFEIKAWWDMRHGERVTSTFDIVGDSYFLIQVRLADGTQYEKQEGYVTRGMWGVELRL